MRIAALFLAIALTACAHGKAGTDLSVSVMHMGSVYAPFPEDCPIDFVNAQHIDILTSGKFDQLGLISVAGTGAAVDRAIEHLPGAVSAAACKMGGTAVSIANMLRTSADQAVLQFSIWRSLEAGKTPAAPAKPASNSI